MTLRAPAPASSSATCPENPILCRIVRGAHVESWHRGSWVLVDTAGTILDGAGDRSAPVFARSSVKSLQALPLFESGAAERFGVTPAETALAVASHDGEALHTKTVAAWLERIGASPSELRCGAHPPRDGEARAELERNGAEPSPLHNNCSGKHTGFLTLARHLGTPPERYLDPTAEPQMLVRRAVAETCGVADEDVTTAIDGCSAPTFRLPLRALATGIARVANPAALAPKRRAACARIGAAVAQYPELIAGSRGRICTDIVRASSGRLFPKVGAEAVYLLGVRGGDRGLALKIDDGTPRALHAVLVGLLERLELAAADEIAALELWRGRPLRNWAGLEVGTTEVSLR